MDIVRRLISVVAVVALAITFIGLGFLACVAPFTTNNLANAFANDANSPFSRAQLVEVANATRDYSFGSHNKLELYQTIEQVDRAYQESIEKTGGTVPSDFPNLRNIAEDSSEAQYQAVFRRASDVYCYTEAEMSHLDDCFRVYVGVIPVLILAAICTIACFIVIAIKGKKQQIGAVLVGGGIGVIVLLVLLTAWAVLDFNGFFASFHTLFFAQGSWTFPAGSLLICALPEGFWVGMGVIWLAATLVCALISIFIGRKLRKHRG